MENPNLEMADDWGYPYDETETTMFKIETVSSAIPTGKRDFLE